MATPVVTVAAGGIAVVDVTATKPLLGMPVSEATNGRGTAVTKVVAPKPGLAVTFVAATLLFGAPLPRLAETISSAGQPMVVAITFDRELGTTLPAPADFTFTRGAEPIHVIDVDIAGAILVLTLDINHVDPTGSTLRYVPGGSVLQGQTGLPVAEFVFDVVEGDPRAVPA